MFAIFEHPWGLLIAAIIALLVVLSIRNISPEKFRWWQWLIPLFIAACAFGVDYLVETDIEQIKAVIKAGTKAVEDENPNAIDAIISAAYNDSHHRTKEALISHCKALLSAPIVEKNRRRNLIIELSLPRAVVTLTVLTLFDKESYIYEFKHLMLTKIKLNLQKEPDKRWLINRVEILEIDKQPVDWQYIR